MPFGSLSHALHHKDERHRQYFVMARNEHLLESCSSGSEQGQAYQGTEHLGYDDTSIGLLIDF